MELEEIPRGTRLPFAYLQFDSSQASAGLQGVQPFKCLLIAEGASNSLRKLPISKDTPALTNPTLISMLSSYQKNSNIEVWGLEVGKLAPIGPLAKSADGVAPISNSSQGYDAEGAFKLIKGMQFNVMTSGIEELTFLSALANELKDRVRATRAIEGFAVVALNGALGDVKDKVSKAGLNSPFIGIMAYPSQTSGTTAAQFASALCGQIGSSAQEDAARPFRTLELIGIAAPSQSNLAPREEREAALNGGISTFYVDANNSVRIERLISTYQTNEMGAPDTSYLSPTTLFALSFMRWDFSRYFGLKYPRHKLASDKYRGNGPVMTPSLAKAECVCLFRNWEEMGLVQDIEAFKAGLICEIDKSDPTRLNIALSPRLVSELDVIGAKLSFLF